MGTGSFFPGPVSYTLPLKRPLHATVGEKILGWLDLWSDSVSSLYAYFLGGRVEGMLSLHGSLAWSEVAETCRWR